jgi:uncharacterized membrane protein HdeD (DUF308 family)
VTMIAGTPDPAELRAHWKLFFGFGIVFVALGVVALGNLVNSTLVTTVIVGFVLVLAGVAQLFSAFASGRGLAGRVLSVLLGTLYVVVGLDLVADPFAGAITLTIVISLMLVIGGVIRIVGAVTQRGRHWGLTLIVGLVNIALGAWLYSGIPVSGVAIGLFVGVDLVLAGTTWILLGAAARNLPADAATVAA